MNICGNAHTYSRTVHTSSINLSHYHLSIFHTTIQMPTIHSSPTDHPSSQISIHPSLTIYFLSIIMNPPPTHCLSTYPPFYTHPSSIYFSSVHPFSQPPSQPSLFHLSVHLPCIHHSSAHRSPATNSHHRLSCIHRFLIHPLFMPLVISLFLIRPSIIPFIIYPPTVSHASSIHRTSLIHFFVSIYHSQANHELTNLFFIHPSFIHHPPSIHSFIKYLPSSMHLTSI